MTSHMSFQSFLSQYASVILFYLLVGFVIYRTRKKWEFQGKIIALYRGKWGIKLMDKIGRKTQKFTKWFSWIGVWVGFLGMLVTVWMIFKGLYNLLFVPTAPATFTPIIPGVHIPGVEVFVPFWYGIIALFVTIVIHEFSHGVVAEAYRMKVKNSGFVMFGPLPGAFVEPDEKDLEKASRKAQLSVYAAGPFSNIVLTIILIILFGFLPLFANVMGGSSPGLDKFTDKTSIVNFAELRQTMYIPTGLEILNVSEGSAAYEAGLPGKTNITHINGVFIGDNLSAFEKEIIGFQNLRPGDIVEFTSANQTWTIVTKPHEQNTSRGQIGIVFNTAYTTEKNPVSLEKYGRFGFVLIEIFFQQIFWIILLSSGIGLANLLPLGPVDGGRMLLTSLERFFSKERAKKVWGKISTGVFVAVIILVIVPIIKNIILG